ncbi:Protein CBG07193 [Caenorhabditis briggsae]|uniref:Protein CBG07193 n=1 Tax=Caenorhabditis briggsae TaxID=6238 RepID=A8X3I0_CAEBR|nr:Protein CBG07193 [Caenorhabditis briggsae]CAP27190.1 Protein CBG07193 [Caenorhabditis briggsae]
MKFLTSILGSDKDRAAKKRRSLEVNLHRLEEKAFLLEMELEETRRQKEKVIKELRNGVPVRHVSTVSVSSTDYSFNTDSSNITDRHVGLPFDTSTPKEIPKLQKPLQPSIDSKSSPPFDEEEEERLKWFTDRQNMENAASTSAGSSSEKSYIEKY